MPAPFTPYTITEIKRAIALKADGLTWAEVAKRMNRPAGSLTVTVSLHRRGLHSPAKKVQTSAEINDALAHAVTVNGVTSLKLLARRINRSISVTHNRLQEIGLDARTRRFAAHAVRKRAAAASSEACA